MKVLIWILCIVLANVIVALLNTFVGSVGIVPSIPIFAVVFGLARFLCKKWDERKS